MRSTCLEGREMGRNTERSGRAMSRAGPGRAGVLRCSARGAPRSRVRAATDSKPGGGEQVRTVAPCRSPCSTISQPPRSRCALGPGDHFAQRLQAVRARIQRRVRLESAHAALDARVIVCNVGRVADDQREVFAGHGGIPRAKAELHVLESEPRGVAGGDQGCRRSKCPCRSRAGVGARGRSQRNRATAGREVENACPAHPAAAEPAPVRPRVPSRAAGSVRPALPRVATTRIPSRAGCRRSARRARAA